MTTQARNDQAEPAEAPPPRLRSFGIECGHEPPLNGSGGEAESVDRRDVNLRWLGASVLTGLTGAGLIGASIYIALQGATVIAQPPEAAAAGAVRHAYSDARAARKGDKLVRQEMIVSAKQGFKAPVTIKAGDREVIRVRQFVRLATNLSLSTGIHATDVPPFNPVRLFAQDAGERYVEPVPETNDTDVSIVRRDLALYGVPSDAPSLSDADVAALLEEERRAGEAGRSPAVPLMPQLMLPRTLDQAGLAPDALGYAAVTEIPFSSIEVRVVPENVTNLPRGESRAASMLLEEKDIALKRGETLEMVLRGLGATPEQIRVIAAALGPPVKIATLPEGQRMRVLLGPGPRPGDPKSIVRVILFGERGVEGIAAMNDRGLFVAVAPPREDAPAGALPASDEEEEDDDQGAVRLYASLYETLLKNEMPRQTVEELVRIFGYDVDFQRRVASGDNIELFYSQDEDSGAPDLLYAALTLGGEPRRVYRYQGEDGVLDFFDENGRSLKKFLVRKPIADGILRSGFGTRRHPILGYAKMHTGVDWANRIGTPIFAAGNGTVVKAGWDGGYGRRIEVQHANGYVTAYSHQSRFAKGVGPGARVRQGQVIGYVGSTGLSTGPHLHYEVLINGRFVDPMKIRLPRGRELDGRAMTEFKRQRDETDALMLRANPQARTSQQAQLR